MFFAVIFIHSNTNPKRYLNGFIALTVAIIFIDWYRYNGEDPVTAAQIKWQWVWPMGYLVLTLLIPYFVKSWNTEGTVPERVTYDH